MNISSSSTSLSVLPTGSRSRHHSTASRTTNRDEVIEEDDVRHNAFCVGLKLSIAYAANIGGTATLTGTVPNLVLKGQLDTLYGTTHNLNFSSWFAFSFPNMLMCLAFAWLWLAIIYLGPRWVQKIQFKCILFEKKMHKVRQKCFFNVIQSTELMVLRWNSWKLDFILYNCVLMSNSLGMTLINKGFMEIFSISNRGPVSYFEKPDLHAYFVSSLIAVFLGFEYDISVCIYVYYFLYSLNTHCLHDLT